MAKTAGIIIIGDEILSGKVEDRNAVFMAKELRSWGVKLARISVIPDEIDEIVEETRKFSSRFDYVFTSGGLGPTHDDVTIEAISKAFEVELVVDDCLRGLLHAFFGSELTPHQLKMARIPKNSKLIMDARLKYPILLYRNLYIFPGIPKSICEKFKVLQELFHEPPIHLQKVRLDAYETEIAEHLDAVVLEYGDVKIGSYPATSSGECKVTLTFESPSASRVEMAVRSFSAKIPPEKVLTVENCI